MRPRDREALIPVDDPTLKTLRKLRVFDERMEKAGRSPLLDATDRQIIDSVLALGRIDGATPASTLGIHRSTVGRRIQRLLKRAGYLEAFAETLLGDFPIAPNTPEEAQKIWRIIKAVGTRNIAPGKALSEEQFDLLNQMQHGRSAARELLYPPMGLKLERRGEKIIITGPGRLDPIFRESVRGGRAVRIFDPPRCHACGRYVSWPPTGRPPKFCSERCRSRYRRR
jgi:hypothetical protein